MDESIDREQPQAEASRRNLPALWDLVIADMNVRDAYGFRTYGKPLRPHNGRDFLRDAYEEALDLAVYLRGAIYERENP